MILNNTTYILKCADGTLYVGSTSNFDRRFYEHNTSRSGAHYTKIRRPVELIYKETFKTLNEARKRENEIKKFKRSEKVELVNMKYDYKYRIKKSGTGLELFANQAFKAKERILEIRGKLMTCYEDEVIDPKIRANCIPYDKERYVSPEGESANFINHACRPNSYITKKGRKLYLVALKNIKKDEEITFDYSTIIASDDSWTMKCHCGNKGCRKVIGKFDALSAALHKQYLAKNMVPSYILTL